MSEMGSLKVGCEWKGALPFACRFRLHEILNGRLGNRALTSVAKRRIRVQYRAIGGGELYESTDLLFATALENSRLMSHSVSNQRRTRQLPELPEFYYHTNFCEMLSFVKARYEHVFEAEHVSFLDAFEALPHNAQCLFVRIAGRKGRVFDTHKLRYSEIIDIAAGLRMLEQTGFIEAPAKSDYRECLTALTKPDLIALMAEHMCASGFKRSWKKEALVDTALAYMPFDETSLPANFIIQGRRDALRYLSYLHLGKIEDNLQSFTLRDLGISKVPDFKADYSARFDTVLEAKAAFFYANALYQLKNGSEDDVNRYLDTVGAWPAPECDVSKGSRDKLLQKLGARAERLEDAETALKLYGLSDAPLCNERAIRLRYKHGDKEWCQARLEALIENPGSDDEHNFAEDFYQRKFNKKRTSEVTDILRQGDVLELDEAFKNDPERAAQNYYAGQGYEIYFTENGLWRTLFGLLFWDELYCSDAATLHNSFERLPASLTLGSFYAQFESEIETKLASLRSASSAHVQILKTVSRHHGTPNSIFRWSGRTIDLIQTFIENAPQEALGAILRRMAQDYKAMRDGFPDLMLLKDNSIRFIEVKASGDVIRRNQLTRIKQLRAAGFQTDVARIDWIIDPNQIYVVVDVETTGGRPGAHRMTELGAVKIQGGQVISEFQTLLNPDRAIPPFITKLTGITDEMVADAPRFEDIADSFSEFMGDAIFAAHNVNFDYGFVSAEYAEIGKRFRHAKICTCSSMRKYYPGRRSYGLKNLCEEFHIKLDTHHRALCDAKAAAELLFLVNDKRTA